ncbi:MAG: bifunctional folylpolyglutamate synthase/dihydrofolate synthase [Campylobacter sp.]|nr:bifunctional folylpolyglutamate synthase/dihydrofolate synthase [Campylobacter sp.]
MKLQDFLYTKPLFYKEIDYTRMPRAWAIVKEHLKPFKIIHIIGTNGKGSTGRFLAQILHLNGYNVGHYTSPHIYKHNERFWQNGKVLDDESLQNAHEKLLEILPKEFVIKTSYFEYATLLSAVLFSECDYFVCEAGMGGEYDATNVFDKMLSLFTPIGLDHTSVLGKNLDEISKTKFKAMCETSILNDDMDEVCVNIAHQIAKQKGSNIKFAKNFLKTYDLEQIQAYAHKFTLPKFLISNLTLAYAACKALKQNLDLSNLNALDLPGRCENLINNIYIDVGHNELGAKAIAQKFKDVKLTLIFNSFLDKDFKSVLKTLKPIIKKVLLYDYECEGRELGGELIVKALDELNIRHEKFQGLSIDEVRQKNIQDYYLAFGSFYLVEAFLRQFYASENL